MKLLLILAFAILAVNGHSSDQSIGIVPGEWWDYRCCPRNEMWVDCAPYCEATCDKPFSVTLPWYNKGGGCVCQPGYVREYEGGQCIKEKCCWEPWCEDCYGSTCDWNIGWSRSSRGRRD